MIELVKLFGGEEILAHTADKCAGRPCAVHNPSNHCMVTFRQHWRSDWGGIMERICPHGVGHPDPDHLGYLATVMDAESLWAEGVHGCCGFGCCRDKEP